MSHVASGIIVTVAGAAITVRLAGIVLIEVDIKGGASGPSDAADATKLTTDVTYSAIDQLCIQRLSTNSPFLLISAVKLS